MLRATRNGRAGFSWRDFAYGFVGVTAIAFLIAILVRGDLLFLRILLPGAIACGLVFWAVGRWGFTLGALAGLPLAYALMLVVPNVAHGFSQGSASAQGLDPGSPLVLLPVTTVSEEVLVPADLALPGPYAVGVTRRSY